MKLLKALAACLLTFVLAFGITGCNSTFCNEEEVTAMKAEIMATLEAGTGTGDYATPEDWSTYTAEEKTSKVDSIYNDSHPKACLTYEDDTDETTGVKISAKSWRYAFTQGFFDGLLTYPFGFLMDKFARWFGLNGYGQLFSIIIVTFLVRLVVTLATWKPTMAQQRMQLLQPEIGQINAKYGNTKDPVQKQKQAQEMMDLYKRYKINPITTMIVPFITLPIFIGVYGAVRATLVLREGTVLGITLAQTLSSGILTFKPTAIALFIIMMALQILSMKLPKLLNREQYKKMDAKARDANKQADTFTYVMLIMVVIVGWMLPVSMSVYWIASSLFTCLQTWITKLITDKQKKKEKEAKWGGVQ
ncbi:MAG: membrane protein insertase YidC [Bacilli bacterium]|jgi:YidC/Oxa1 family membrane protein insertase|nr:membrane protein insertase YidC [Bacilli bacterium]MDD3421920.1 membrane protein insertase YidC [Bacilli bacterium]MDD4065723.1 membrane protein insertase YidC [Bacilli bacterium]